MQTNKIRYLTEKAFLLNRKSVSIYNSNPMMPLRKEQIDWVASQLDVRFSSDFYDLNEAFSYEYFSSFELACFYIEGQSGVLNLTYEYRTSGLPHRFVVLSNQGDAGSILIETQNSSEKLSPVIWCDYEDLWNLCEKGVFEYNPTIWPSFTDFFEYLVEQEEEMLKEQEK